MGTFLRQVCVRVCEGFWCFQGWRMHCVCACMASATARPARAVAVQQWAVVVVARFLLQALVATSSVRCREHVVVNGVMSGCHSHVVCGYIVCHPFMWLSSWACVCLTSPLDLSALGLGLLPCILVVSSRHLPAITVLVHELLPAVPAGPTGRHAAYT
jgi:hypothetical protein